MMRVNRAFAAGIALIFWFWLCPAGSAHYVDLDAELVQPGTLTFGVAVTGPPFAYRQDGELLGFEIAVARQVARANGLKLELVQLSRSGLVTALKNGDVDAVNTFALEGERAGISRVPYLVAGDHMMVLRGNPFRIHSPDDLAGRVVAVTSGSSGERFAQAINQELSRNGRESMHVHSFPDQRYTHFPVSMGHAQAYFLPTISAIAVSQDPEARTRLVEGAFEPRTEVGFGMRADRQQIHHAIEHSVAAMVATGKYDGLLAHYGLPTDVSPFR